VPSLKTAIQNFFGRPLSFTLNQDEAVARGAAFSCAIHSPVFRVREFAVHDINNYPIEFTWEKSPDIPDEDTSLTVFNKGNAIPSTKILTFYRKQPFDLEAKYAKPEQLPGKISPWIGRFSVKGVKADAKDDFMICKLKARINPHGILNVEQGYYVEEQEVEEPVPDAKADGEKKDGDVRNPFHPSTPAREAARYDQARTRKHDGTLPREAPAKRQKERESVNGTVSSSVDYHHAEAVKLTDSQAMETDEKAPATNGKKTRKVKKQVRKGDLPLVAGTASLDQESKNAAAEKENEMHMEDKLVKDTEDKKNELETFMYELRERIHGIYDEFSSDEEKEKILAKCSHTEVCRVPNFITYPC
jgi:heat shock protein 4